jgi:hypothetical protein
VTLSIRSREFRDVEGSIAHTAIHTHRAKNFVLGVPLGGEGLTHVALNRKGSKGFALGMAVISWPSHFPPARMPAWPGEEMESGD